MRTLSPFCVLLLSAAFSACTPSENVTTANGSARPAVGSLYFYSQESLDANGNVDPSVYRTDSVWRVLAHDTVIGGFSHVVQFASGDSVNAPDHPRRMNVRYLDNGDIAVSEESSESLHPWITLPLGSRSSVSSYLDSTVDTHDGLFHISGTIRSEFVGTAVVSISPKRLDALVGLSTVTAVIARSGDTGRFVTRTTWTYAPAIGFFTYIKEEQSGTDVDGHPENQGSRMNLSRYVLK
jgi:hypothetical protein